MSRKLLGRLVAVSLAALVSTAAAGPADASFTQEPGSPFDVGVRPTGVLTADFNADGRPDLLSIDETTVSLLLRRPTGGYALEAGSPIPVGSGPSGAAIADFDGDGRLDVAVCNIVSEDVTVLLRQPAGGFAQGLGSPIALGFQPGAIAAGDFAGTVAPDLVVTNYFGAGGGAKVLRREGTGFVIQADTLPTGNNPRAIATADFDGAGGTDLAITNAGSSSITVLLRQGATFNQETGSPVTVGATPQGIVARDFDGDARPDLAVADFGDDNVRLLVRQPGSGFAQGGSVAVGDGPVGIASGDFNSDGLPDLVTGNQTASTASVLLRTSAGGFVPDPSSPVATDTGASGVAVADVDADSRPDLAVANYTDSSVSVLLNTTPFPLPPPLPNLDADGDGVQRPLDCDDTNPAIKPGAVDRPGDGIDQDCANGDAPYPLLDRRISAFLATYRHFTKFTALAVKKVRGGDTLKLTCRGRGCPLRKKTIAVKKDRKKLSLLPYVKGAKLRRGAVVKLRVTRQETVGRFARWKMRSPKPPTRKDACLPPGAKRPQSCPD